MINAIILAAGSSTRFKSSTSKVLHNLIDKPLISYIMDALKPLNVDNTVLVVNKDHAKIKALLGDNVIYAVQEEQLGTAHAVATATQVLEGVKGETLIVMGDCPLVETESLQNLLSRNQNYDLTLITAVVEEPAHYGRIVKNKFGQIEKIVEFKHATPQEKRIKEINMGVYCIKNEVLLTYLPYIINNTNSGEFKFTDIVEFLVKTKHKVQTIVDKNYSQFLGVNTKEDYNKVLNTLRDKINAKHTHNGVLIINPENTYIGSNVEIGNDVTIYPNSFIIGNTKIADNVSIYANSYLENAEIGNNVTIESAKIINSSIGDNSIVGPFAHIRNNSKISNNVRIGNFVEVKNSFIDEHSKVAHLAYIGDAEIGKHVNIGCGVITVNYDGKNKHKTKICDHAFIGSNVNLIAPITIGSGALVAAGSTVTQDVEPNAMAIARSYQTNKPDYALKYFNKNETT